MKSITHKTLNSHLHFKSLDAVEMTELTDLHFFYGDLTNID